MSIDLLRDPDHLNSLLQDTPVRTRLRFLESNYELWKDTFPLEAILIKRKLRVVE